MLPPVGVPPLKCTFHSTPGNAKETHPHEHLSMGSIPLRCLTCNEKSIRVYGVVGGSISLIALARVFPATFFLVSSML